jgi:methionyl-tRNA formyltransferase
MRIVVFAYSDIGYECLRVLIRTNEEIAAVVTHEDDPSEEIWFRSVAELARAHCLPVHAPSNPNTPAFVDLIRGYSPDLIFSFYYRRLLCKDILGIPRLGGINLHGSLLPRYRGRCPVNWALINGEAETGVTLHYMTEKADAGDIIAQEIIPIGLDETVLDVSRKLSAAAVDVLGKTYPLIKAGKAPRAPQDPRMATTFRGRRPEDGRITWDRPSSSIYNLIRAVTHPYPGAFTYLAGTKLYVWRATLNQSRARLKNSSPGVIEAVDREKGIQVATGDGYLYLTTLQFDREGEFPARELVERQRLSVGSHLGP